MSRVQSKRGDTLIEVILAVGIFSMVAVAVLAVMNGGASSAQLSLEATLAREEVDTQAEALRFVHSSYIAEKISSTNGKYTTLWNAIVGKASSDSGANAEFSPAECASLYGDTGESKNGFIINTRGLGAIDTMTDTSGIVEPKEKLIQTTTYPRLVYDDYNDTLVNNGESTNLVNAEGIYIVAVKGENEGGSLKYYDFYIRTCWYGSGESAASTIYTLVRLSDPSQ